MKKFSFFLLILLLTRVGTTYAAPNNGTTLDFQNFLSNFAALVAEHEREACAEVCERLNMGVAGNDELTGERCVAAKECSDAIRERGQA